MNKFKREEVKMIAYYNKVGDNRYSLQSFQDEGLMSQPWDSLHLWKPF
jgi:hypothetical protein